MHSYLAGRLQVPHAGHGVDNRHAKLTDDNVRRMREMSAGGRSNAEVARAFGIDRSIVSRIRNRQTWKHVI
jgi:DNA invertase Pin-like site-specific DNA recombinase